MKATALTDRGKRLDVDDWVQIKDSPEGQRKGKRALDIKFPLLRWIPVTPGGPGVRKQTALALACPTFTLPAGDGITGGCCPLEAT